MLNSACGAPVAWYFLSRPQQRDCSQNQNFVHYIRLNWENPEELMMKCKRKSFTVFSLNKSKIAAVSVSQCLVFKLQHLILFATDDNVIFWREAFSKTLLLSEFLLLDVGRLWVVVWHGPMETDGLVYSFFFFTGCLSLNGGTGPSSTNNIYFAMRRVQGVCKLELLFFLLSPCSTLHPPPPPPPLASSRPVSRIWVCRLRNAALCLLSKEHFIWFLTCRTLTPRVRAAQFNMPIFGIHLSCSNIIKKSVGIHLTKLTEPGKSFVNALWFNWDFFYFTKL